MSDKTDTPRTDALSSDPVMVRRDVPARVWREMARMEIELSALQARVGELDRLQELTGGSISKGTQMMFCLTHFDEQPVGDGWSLHCAFPKFGAVWFQAAIDAAIAEERET
jgi:hypothetical protein